MFAGLTTNYTLESLLFQAEEVFSAAGIDLPDHIIVYDCVSISEMIDKLNRGILFYQFEVNKIKDLEQQICENPEYLKYIKLNALSEGEHQALLKNYEKKIEELQDQILKLDKEFRGM
jgi:hypothetical protein